MAIPRYRSAEAWPLLSAGFRPFFLIAGLWACFSMAIWILMLSGAIALPTACDPVAWHFHELLFGFVAAAIAGFLLTAIPDDELADEADQLQDSADPTATREQSRQMVERRYTAPAQVL